MLLSVILTFSIVGIYRKSEHAKATALIWAILIGMLVLFGRGVSYYLLLVPVVYLIGWGIFSLATYLEESVFLRLLVLLFGAVVIFSSFGGFKMFIG